MPLHHHGDPAWVNRYTNVAGILDSSGNVKQIADGTTGRYANIAANGDRYFLYFICDGSEKMFEITTYAGTNRGIWDMYVNGVLDSSGYDDYFAPALLQNREIPITGSIPPGRNVIELRVNGKNASSSGYVVFVTGASLQ